MSSTDFIVPRFFPRFTRSQSLKYPILTSWNLASLVVQTCYAAPQQFEMHFPNGTGIYIRIRGTVTAYFCLTGDLKIGDPLIYSRDTTEEEEIFMNEEQLYPFFEELIPKINTAIQEYEQTGQVTSVKSHTGRELGDPIVYANDEQYDESRFQEEQEHYQQEAEYSENECYSPTSPVYRPSSPSYSPTSPTHE